MSLSNVEYIQKKISLMKKKLLEKDIQTRNELHLDWFYLCSKRAMCFNIIVIFCNIIRYIVRRYIVYRYKIYCTTTEKKLHLKSTRNPTKNFHQSETRPELYKIFSSTRNPTYFNQLRSYFNRWSWLIGRLFQKSDL